jgi:hypothetical protein
MRPAAERAPAPYSTTGALGIMAEAVSAPRRGAAAGVTEGKRNERKLSGT